ncbi:MAG TPA: DNA-binding response regulator, partial [Nitrospiraceae bacterium]|nr:DNA-binding response regulator [Nitrospiraceae bacterium]
MKASVLIVDDEPDILIVMTANLRKEGYVVDTAGDGDEALRMTESRDYDTIILDQQMPRVTGMEFLRKLRAGGDGSEGGGVPVIVV